MSFERCCTLVLNPYVWWDVVYAGEDNSCLWNFFHKEMDRTISVQTKAELETSWRLQFALCNLDTHMNVATHAHRYKTLEKYKLNFIVVH